MAAQPIRLALLGAGLFATDAYVPALAALENTFDVVAVYSRTQESAAALVERLDRPADIYTDLVAVLARQDVEAVAIVLPLFLLPAIVEMALAAGKHVISEKPIAPDVVMGQRLIDKYCAQYADQVWMVAENWRYEAAFVMAEEIIHSGQIGNPMLAHWIIHAPLTPDNKYYHTLWRRAGDFPGGMLLDGGVHRAAALRMLLGEISSVSAVVTQLRDDLPPADTMSAAIHFENGAVCSHAVTYCAGSPWIKDLHILGEKGALRVGPGIVELTIDGATQTTTVEKNNGVREELAAFAAAIRDDVPHRNSPQEALQDVAVIQAMLQSAEISLHTKPSRILLDARRKSHEDA